MPVPKVACPSCSSMLKLGATLQPGKKVQCPKCEYIFRIPEGAPEEAAPAQDQAPTPRKRRFRDEDLEEDEEGATAAPARAEWIRSIWDKHRLAVSMLGLSVVILIVVLVMTLSPGHGEKRPERDPLAKDKPPPQPTITKDAYEQIKLGTRLAEIETLLGKGTRVEDTSTLPRLDKQVEDVFWKEYRKGNPTALFVWDEAGNWIAIGFGGKGGEEVAVFKAFFFKDGAAQKVIYQN